MRERFDRSLPGYERGVFCALNKLCHVLFELLEHRWPDVHHMARFIVGQTHPLTIRGLEAQMIKGPFRGGKWRGHVIDAIGDKDL